MVLTSTTMTPLGWIYFPIQWYPIGVLSIIFATYLDTIDTPARASGVTWLKLLDVIKKRGQPRASHTPKKYLPHHDICAPLALFFTVYPVWYGLTYMVVGVGGVGGTTFRINGKVTAIFLAIRKLLRRSKKVVPTSRISCCLCYHQTLRVPICRIPDDSYLENNVRTLMEGNSCQKLLCGFRGFEGWWLEKAAKAKGCTPFSWAPPKKVSKGIRKSFSVNYSAICPI